LVSNVTPRIDRDSPAVIDTDIVVDILLYRRAVSRGRPPSHGT
jgi:hypothetical protein